MSKQFFDIKTLIEEATEEQLQKLEEAFTMSMVQRSREAKINAAVGAIAVSMAKKANDPLYFKLVKYRKLWKETKNRIVAKYGARAYQQWVSNKS